MNGPNDGWEQLPRDFRHLDVADVAVDSRDRVYALTRYDSRVIVYEPDGTFIRSWGEPFLSARPHGLTIGPDDCAYLVDDGDQTVKKYTLDGQLLLTLGTSGESSDTGIDRPASSWAGLIESIKGGPPFNRPTSAAVAPNGDLYVADGYGNCKVHHYDSSGNLIESFGEPGGEPGAFRTPHDITIDPLGRLLVADRENERIQVFDAAGNFVEQWSDMRRPSSVVTSGDRVFVAEFPIPVGGYTWPRGENYEYVDGGSAFMTSRESGSPSSALTECRGRAGISSPRTAWTSTPRAISSWPRSPTRICISARNCTSARINYRSRACQRTYIPSNGSSSNWANAPRPGVVGQTMGRVGTLCVTRERTHAHVHVHRLPIGGWSMGGAG